MSSNTPAHEETRQARRLVQRRQLILALTDRLIWWSILFGASAVWFLFGMRLMSWLGPDTLGPPAGVMLATAVGVTLWRWAARDSHHETIEAGACPRCAAPITRFEEPSRPGALVDGLRGCRCDNCGLEDSEPLTAVHDAS